MLREAFLAALSVVVPDLVAPLRFVVAGPTPKCPRYRATREGDATFTAPVADFLALDTDRAALTTRTAFFASSRLIELLLEPLEEDRFIVAPANGR